MPKIYGNTEILGGDLTVLGNMVISGTQTSLNVEELYVSDNIITLNATFSGSPVLDSGIEINRGNSTNSRLIWNETTDYWVAGLSGSESTIITEAGSGLTKSNNQLEVDFGTVSSIAYVDSKNTGIYGGSGALPSDIIVNTSGFDIEFSGSGGLKTTNVDASWSIGQGNTPSYQFYQVATTHNTAHYIIQQKADATNPIYGSRILSNTTKSGANAVYGYFVSIEGTHAAGNNVGGYFNAINGNNNYALLTNDGNVGIGELTPTEQLHVGGSIRMVDGNEGVGKVLTDVAGDGVGSWETPSGISGTGTTNYIPKWSSATGLTDSLASSDDTGVGIGTASADNMLTVFGDVNITGDYLIHSDTITTLGGTAQGSVTWFDHDGDTVHMLHNSDTSGINAVARFIVGDFTTPANKVHGQFAYFSPTYLTSGGSPKYQNMLVMKANSGLDGMILDVDSGSGKTITILPESADVVFSESTGFSGFGTASPVEKVEVVGNIKITGQVYVDIPVTLSPSTNSQNIDWDNGNIQVVDFQSAPTGVTFSFSNQKTGGTYTIKIIQGSNLTTVNWPTSIKWESGVSLIPTSIDNALDLVTMVYDGTDYYASFGKNFT